MKCSYCNQIIPDESIFCQRCGNKVLASEPKNKDQDIISNEVFKAPKNKKRKLIATIVSISLLVFGTHVQMV